MQLANSDLLPNEKKVCKPRRRSLSLQVKLNQHALQSSLVVSLHKSRTFLPAESKEKKLEDDAQLTQMDFIFLKV